MNSIKYALAVLSFIVLMSILFAFSGDNAEKIIIGDWKEISWEYEKLGHHNDSKVVSIDEGIKDEIYEDIILHKSENWLFHDDGTLLMTNSISGEHEELYWSIKGRGHILELTHKDGRIEDYQIEMLSDKMLVIYFSFDIQIRGIVKITFAKT